VARVGLVFGGRSVEHRVSVVSARTVAAALREANHEVVPLGVAEDGGWVSGDVPERCLAGEQDSIPALGLPLRETLSILIDAEIDVAFPIVHGTWGEDGTLQGLFEMLDLPYVGAGVTTSAVAMDKAVTKAVLRDAGVPVVDSIVVTEADLPDRAWPLVAKSYGFPLFVKPCVGGSSVGVYKVPDEIALPDLVRKALSFDHKVLVEKAVLGRELECSVLGDDRLEASAIGEIVPGHDFYDYEDKYIDDTADLRIPAELDRGMEIRLQEYAVEAFGAIGGHGMARVDFLVGEDESIYVNEINTLPGFTSISMYPKLWGAVGLPIDRLVDRLVGIAFARHEKTRALDGAIKSWLASVASDAG